MSCAQLTGTRLPKADAETSGHNCTIRGVRSDFYLASAAVIPLLMFVDLAAQAIDVNIPIRLGTARLVANHQSGLIRFAWLAFVFWWLFFGWAEWICLRSLETGHSATGGPTVIWLALAFLAIQAAATMLRLTPSIRGARAGP